MTIYVYQHKVTKLLTLSETACAGELWELIDEYDVPDPGEGGGGEGTTNYNQLTNKPQVNGVTLSGNKTSLELKIKVGDVDTLTTTSKDTTVAAINELDGDIGNRSDLVTSAKSTVVAAINELNEKLGNLDGLTTTAKNSLVAAINEHDDEIGSLSLLTTDVKNKIVGAINELDADIGNRSDLVTSARTTVVAAINEVDNKVGKRANLTTAEKGTIVGAVNELDNDIGSPADLTTAAKNNVVAAINEHDSEIGNLSSLTTAAKNTIVAAVNELDSDVGDKSTLKTSTKTSVVAGLNELHDNVLEKDNTTAFTPDADYEPATKKYVDDAGTALEAEIAALTTTGGVKNIVPNEGADTFTQAGITFTKNADGSVTANGTATSTAIYRMKENLTLPKGKYVISGSPSGAADDKFFIQLHKQGVVTHRDTNNPIYPQEWDETGETVYDWYGVAFLNGTVADNMTFYPMIRPQGTSADYVEGMYPNPVLASEEEVAAIANVGAKNILPSAPKPSNASVSEVSVTDISDGAFTFQTIATTTGVRHVEITGFFALAAGTYKFSVGTALPSSVTATVLNASNTVICTIATGQREAEFTLANSGNVRFLINIATGTTVASTRIYPMLRLAAIKDDTYVPYGMDNASLTGVAEVVMDDKNISGRYNGDNCTRAGVTFTLNADGSVTATGTATAHAYYYCNIGFKLKAGRTYRISSGLAANTNGTSMQIIVNNSAAADTLTSGYMRYKPTEDVEATVCVVVRSGNTVNNLKIYPMLMDDRIPDKSYTPPVMSNAEITAELSDTGWITLKTGIRYRKKNGVVTVVVALDTTDIPTLAGGSWQNLNSDAPIPTTARPTIVYPVVAHARKATGNENDFFQAQVNTGGAIQILVPNSMTVNSTNYNMLRLEVSFPV